MATSADHVEVSGTAVTVNAADIADTGVDTTTQNGGWIYFEFATPVTLAGATGYEIEAQISQTNVTFWRDGTAGNASRLLVTTANPADVTTAGMTFDVCKRYTGAGASTAVTVTMNHTATTDYGAGTADLPTLTISGATVAYAYAASTNYYLKSSGDIIVYRNGTFTIGTVANPIPSTGSAVLEFDPAADGDNGLIVKNGATFVAQGASMTKVWTTLAADAASTATTVTTTDSTGWKDGQTVTIAPTTRTAAQVDTRLLSGDASGTSITLNSGLTYAHDGGNGGPGGVSDAAEMVNLTRNVKIRSATSTLMAYMNFKATSTVNMDYVECYYLGENTAGQRGVEIETTTGSCAISYCSFWNFEDGGLYVTGTATNNITIEYNVLVNMNSDASMTSTGAIALMSATSGTTITIDNNVIIFTSGTTFAGLYLGDVGGTITNNRIAGVAGTTTNGGLVIAEGSALILTMTGNVIHSCTCLGVYWTGTSAGTISGGSVWRNNQSGLQLSGAVILGPLVLSGIKIFGNVAPQIGCAGTNASGDVVFDTLVIDPEASYTAAQGFSATFEGANVRMHSCTFGTNGTTHATADIVCGDATNTIHLFSCTLGSATEVGSYATALGHTGFVKSYRHDNSATTHKNWYRYGIVASDQTLRHTASGYSWKLTPNTASPYKLILPGPSSYDTFKVACPASAARTITVWAMRDASYNGSEPRLVVKGGIVPGIASDVTDSMSAGTADLDWEQLSVQVTPTEDCVVEFYCDADGTAGSCYFDDVAVT